jgi:hypothetical protein
MASVTFPSVDRTYDDTRNPLTGLGGGGHRKRLIPLFSDAITEIATRIANQNDPGFSWNFSTATAAADPGPGLLAFNSATPASVTAVYLDLLNVASIDLTNWLAQIGASTSANKGRLRVRSLINAAKWIEFNVTAATSGAGFYTLTVALIQSAGAAFAAGESLGVSFSRTGDKGEPGLVSAAADGSASAPAIAFSSQTNLGFYRKSASLIALAAGGADLLELRPATQAEAEAGTNNTLLMTPLRVLQSVRRNAVGNAGGQTVTGDVTLTVTSSGAIVANPTGAGFFATLPAANTMPTAGPGVFSIFNASAFYYGIRNNAGTRLGWVPPCSGVVIDLVSNSTAAGTWNCVGAEKVAVTAQYLNATLSAIAPFNMKVIDMGSDRTLFLLGGTSLYGLVYDGATRAWGALTLIRSGTGNSLFAGVRTIAGTQALVCSCAASSTAFQAVVLTIATTAITVNTAAAITLDNTATSIWQMISVGASWVVSIAFSGISSEVRAITVSGVTPTIGARVDIGTSNSIPLLFVTGSVLRVVARAGSGVSSQPFTVSGVTLTAGTAASVSGLNEHPRAYVNSNGNIVALTGTNTGIATAVIFRLTGTVEAQSSIDLGLSRNYNENQFDMIDVGSGKTLIVACGQNVTGFVANLLTDTSGTASVGTAFTFLDSETLAGSGAPTCLFAGGGVARVATYANSANPNYTRIKQLVFNTTGASLALTTAHQLLGVTISEYTNGSLYEARNPRLMRANASVYLAPQPGVRNSGMALFTASGIVALPRPSVGLIAPSHAGAADFQSWGTETLTASTMGFMLSQWEVAE